MLIIYCPLDVLYVIHPLFIFPDLKFMSFWVLQVSIQEFNLSNGLG